jgi:Ca2+/H+ antiporter
MTMVAIVLLIALASTGLGVAIGSATRKFQRVTAIGIPLSLDLFFLSGGITIAAFLPPLASDDISFHSYLLRNSCPGNGYFL